MNTAPTKHKRFDEVFNRAAVEHWQISEHSATRIAVELVDAARN